jgi:hypothetical protein
MVAPCERASQKVIPTARKDKRVKDETRDRANDADQEIENSLGWREITGKLSSPEVGLLDDHVGSHSDSRWLQARVPIGDEPPNGLRQPGD